MATVPWSHHSVRRLAAEVRAGERRAADHVQAFAERADVVEGRTHAIAQRIPMPNWSERGSLAGVPIAVKDSIAVADVPWAAGVDPAGVPPALSDASVVQRLRNAGAAVVATTNMPAFAALALSVNGAHGTVTNPAAPGYHAGGSSGGSAAAVAAGEVPLTVGTDTAGSILIPAALCGVYGMRPTLGAVPTDGVHALAPTFDTVGGFASRACDLSELMHVLLDDGEVAPVLAATRVGFLGGWFAASGPVGDLYDAWLERVRSRLGVALDEVVLPGAERAFDDARTVYLAESARTLADASSDLPGVAERVRRGAGIGDPEIAAARAGLEQWRAEVDAALARTPLLLCVASLGTAPSLQADPESAGLASLHNSYPLCAAGVPVVSVPIGRVDGLPVGAVLIGAPGSDVTLLEEAVRFAEQGLTKEPRADD